MKVLMTIPHVGVHGPIPKLVALMSKGLRELGVDVIEVPYSRRLVSQAGQESFCRKIFDRTSDLSNLISHARKSKPDILFANTAQDMNCFLRDIPMAAAAKTLGLPTVLFYHGSSADLLEENRLLRYFTSMLFSLSNGLVVLSQEEILPFRRYWPDHRLGVVRYPAVIEVSDESVLNFQYPPQWVGSKLPLLLFAGRLIPPKGIQELVEAMPVVLRQVQCRLAVLGEGELYKPLQERVRELRLEEFVYFTGYVKDEQQLHTWYRKASCFVLPTYWREGFPVVILEAMAYGLPIVCTRVRGIADYLHEGEHAFFTEPRNPKMLASRLVELLKNPSIRVKMGDANRELIRQFRPAMAMQDYVDFFREVSASQDK